ncbi:MAG: 5'-nucleotidase C-terminal domain-containing protein [Armatimonadetes bacterium]|nr:5'-nucleotidase C-terminal domain-containing protein [Armatimonadota bacterium]
MKTIGWIKRYAAVGLVLMLCAGAAFGASVVSESPLSAAGASKEEVPLGDLVADAVRAALDTDTAFISASELKERDVQIARGKVSTEDIKPFIAYPDDPIVEVRLTGKQMKQALERSVLIYPQKNLGFLQVSGVSFTFDPSKPQEDRVTSVRVGNRQLSEEETYSVAMTSSMANGALGYWKIWSKDDRSRVTDITIPQAVDQFFAAREKINYSNLNRINPE